MDAASKPQPALIAAKYVATRAGMSRSQLYALVAQGKFPPPVVQQHRFTRWQMAAVDGWIENPTAWLSKAAA